MMHEDMRDLASLVAEIIRKMGAAYGPPEEWRRDITKAVKIMEHNNVLVHELGIARIYRDHMAKDETR
jgi:hypothetical protein